MQHKRPIVGFHCSGATGQEWHRLKSMSAGQAPVLTPDFYGCPSRGPWQGKSFSFADEAAPLLPEIRALGAPVHLVAHSYGGGVALHILRHHPDLVASLCLYEPTSFHVLRDLGGEGEALIGEIVALNGGLRADVEAGLRRKAASDFTEFWSGPGAFDALSPERQAAMQDWVPKVVSDFDALVDEPETPGDLRRDLPVTLIWGSETKVQTRRIIDVLTARFDAPEVHCLDGAGHMGPFTHRDQVFALVAAHIARAEPA